LGSASAGARQATAQSDKTEPDWLTALRRRGEETFSSLSMPVRKDKGWEFTDLSRLDLEAFSKVPEGDLSSEPSRETVVEQGERPAVLQVDGVAARQGTDETQGAIVSTLENAIAEHPELVEPYLGSLVLDRDKFSAQNTASWLGGGFVYVPKGVRLETPVILSAIQATPGSAMFWRSLVVVEQEAELTVVEQYLSGAEQLEAYFNPVSELVIGEGATVSYLCVQDLSEQSWILGSQRAQVERDASLHWVGLGLGSGQGKLRMETGLRGRGGDARVTGAYVGHGSQHLDYDTTQEHAAPDTTSDLAFRGILRDRATAVWSGMIRVEPGAQRTDAFQESRNLLLSDGAHADAIPGLEIEANDVRCTHAATVSQIDKEQLFYLRSRGIERQEAERLLVGGFLGVVAARLEGSQVLHAAVSAALERELERALD
jgi:Fe-S cluster assembly protein SufD